MSATRTTSTSQPWIYSPLSDGLFILLPAFAATLAIVCFPEAFSEANEVPVWAWLVLIVGIDVSHVYSTLYRTYFDSEEFGKYKKPLILIPIIGFFVGVGLYLAGSHIFWSILAYLAVYHFVRQQYGFFRIYARKEKVAFPWEKHLDSAAIYGATIYPLLYWHTHLPRNFNWFMTGDFIPIPWEFVSVWAGFLYVGILIAYGIKEIRQFSKTRHFNLPKNLILLGTALSWYIGIVRFNGDLAFTATNVIAHGIPYMALVWMYGRKKREKQSPEKEGKGVFQLKALPIFVGAIFIFGFLEEGFWDALVWRDHPQLFGWFENLPHITHPGWLAVIIPLLALPQVTHYLIDGFIWRVRGQDTQLKGML